LAIFKKRVRNKILKFFLNEFDRYRLSSLKMQQFWVLIKPCPYAKLEIPWLKEKGVEYKIPSF